MSHLGASSLWLQSLFVAHKSPHQPSKVRWEKGTVSGRFREPGEVANGLNSWALTQATNFLLPLGAGNQTFQPHFPKGLVPGLLCACSCSPRDLE